MLESLPSCYLRRTADQFITSFKKDQVQIKAGFISPGNAIPAIQQIFMSDSANRGLFLCGQNSSECKYIACHMYNQPLSVSKTNSQINFILSKRGTLACPHNDKGATLNKCCKLQMQTVLWLAYFILQHDVGPIKLKYPIIRYHRCSPLMPLSPKVVSVLMTSSDKSPFVFGEQVNNFKSAVWKTNVLGQT